MLLLHSRLLTTITLVTIILLCYCLLCWIRTKPLGRIATALHGILGLLFSSAALLGGIGSTQSTVPPLHVVYAVFFPVVWLFLWQGVPRMIAPTEHARYWVVSAVILLVLLQRIAVTGQ
jgi:hypothetical protein